MPATPTYTLIEEQILGSAQASVTFGSGGTIPQTYKDLVLEVVCAPLSGSTNLGLQFNGDTGTNYSQTQLVGNGTAASSGRGTNETSLFFASMDAGALAVNFAQIMSYANGSVYKSVLGRGNASTYRALARVGLWRSTAAITSLVVTNDGATSFATGSTFRLWGIA